MVVAYQQTNARSAASRCVQHACNWSWLDLSCVLLGEQLPNRALFIVGLQVINTHACLHLCAAGMTTRSNSSCKTALAALLVLVLLMMMTSSCAATATQTQAGARRLLLWDHPVPGCPNCWAAGPASITGSGTIGKGWSITVPFGRRMLSTNNRCRGCARPPG